MRFEGLSATADLVGRRLRVAWEYALEGLDTPGDVPPVRLRRKERDFEFPPPAPADPYTVYDDAAFPPAPVPGVLQVLDLPAREGVEDGLRVTASGVSVARVQAGTPQEVMRRVVRTVVSPAGAPVRLRFELLDALDLAPRTAYYYELDDGSAPGREELERYRAVAVPGGTHGLNRRLYEMLPEAYKRHDVRALPPADELPGVPEASPAGGQLRRFTDMFGMGLDALRSSAENLLDLHDASRTEARFLPALSRMVGWEPTSVAGVALQRNELQSAGRLFDVVGTVPALRALVTYQTGWHAQVAEFAQHVLRANEPARRGVQGVEEHTLPAPGWRGVDDASAVFGFPPAGATGAGALPAVLTSTETEPFALRAGMELTLTVDNGVPARVRFGPDDFADIGAATAAEVAASISAAFDTLVARDVAGAVELRTHGVGPAAAVQAGVASTTLIALGEAPAGPLSAFADSAGRIRLFYEERRDPGRGERALAPPEGEDAATVFGFPAGTTSGTGTLPAVVASARREPFALRGGTELVVAVDAGAPMRVRLRAADFANVRTATAAEVAAALSAALAGAEARAVEGRVEIRTVSAGPAASLRVRVADPPPAPGFASSGTPEPLRRRIRYRSWGDGEWRGDVELPPWTGEAAEPWAAELPDGRVWLCWRDAVTGRPGYALGQPRAATPAVITGHAAEPFALQPGSQLVLRGSFGTETFTVFAPDYPNPSAATAAQVATAMGVQLVGVAASPAAGGVLRLTTADTGSDATISTDLAQSTAARTLGFAARGLAGRGGWDPEIDWTGPLAMPPAWGAAADPSAVRDPLGGARAFWCEHHGARWEVRQAHWSERLTVVTPAGAGQRTTGAWQTWRMADGLPSDDVRAVAVDATGTLWFATPAGLARRRPDGAWAVLTTVDGLGSDDVRGLAFLPDGDLWCATPAGVSVVRPNGAVGVIVAAPGGLVDDDVRAVAADGRGNAWAATPAGVSRRDPEGRWKTWTTADGLAPGAPRAVAAGAGGRIAVGTAAGVSVLDEARWRTYTAADGLPSADVRALAWGEDDNLAVATAGGVALWNGRGWRGSGTAEGLPSADARAVAFAPDGRLVVGTAAGLAIGGGTAWTVETAGEGLPSSLVVGVHTTWSAPVVLSQGGGGHREPRAAVDGAGRTWLVWARRTEVRAVARPTWTLRLRRFDPAAWAWEPDSAVTTSPGGTSDREPALEPRGGGGFRVFFSSDRGGGRRIGWIELTSGGVPGVLASLPAGAAETTAPVAVPGPGGRTWMFHRSDRSIVPAQVGVLPPLGQGRRGSERVPDAGALRLHAGCRTPVLAHAARNLGRRTWGDLFTYTPQHPDRVADDAPADDHLYTRRTVGLFLRQARTGHPITREQIERLLQLLRRYLPVNLRLVLIVSPDPLVELVYTPGADLADSWADEIPLVEVLGGLVDTTGVVAPEWAVLITNALDSLSASPVDPTTLRRRTWFPDLL